MQKFFSYNCILRHNKYNKTYFAISQKMYIKPMHICNLRVIDFLVSSVIKYVKDAHRNLDT